MAAGTRNLGADRLGRDSCGWVTTVAIGSILLVALLVLGGAYLFRSHPKAKSVDSAVRQYRRSGGGVAPTPGFAVPAAGVYRAAGHGGESISMPPNSQDDGAVMPITVTLLPGGCWRWRIDYNTAHWHELDFCPKGKELLLVAQRNFQAWDLGATTITNTGSYTCDPPSPIVVERPVPNQRFTHSCVGDNTAAPGRSVSAGPSTIVGSQTLRVDGTQVATIHQRRRQRMTGPQQGTLTEDWWFDARTGLPIRSERHYSLSTTSPVGTIRYREHGAWQLTTLTPRT